MSPAPVPPPHTPPNYSFSLLFDPIPFQQQEIGRNGEVGGREGGTGGGAGGEEGCREEGEAAEEEQEEKEEEELSVERGSSSIL